MLFGFFTKQIELLDPDWMNNLKHESRIRFTLNGVKIGDNRTKLELVLNRNQAAFRINYPLVDDQTLVEYICSGYRYKIQKDRVVGFAITSTNISREEVSNHFGEPTDVTPIIGAVFSMDLFEIEGYIWEYKNLNVEITLDEEQLIAQAFHIGKKLYYFDN